MTQRHWRLTPTEQLFVDMVAAYRSVQGRSPSTTTCEQLLDMDRGSVRAVAVRCREKGAVAWEDGSWSQMLVLAEVRPLRSDLRRVLDRVATKERRCLCCHELFESRGEFRCATCRTSPPDGADGLSAQFFPA